LSDTSLQVPDFASSRRIMTALAEGPFTFLNDAPMTTSLSVPWERLSRGPTGGRFSTHIRGEDTSRNRPMVMDTAFEAIAYNDVRCPANTDDLIEDRAFLAQHAYAVAASTLDLFESTMGRRLGWRFRGHRLALELWAPIDFASSGYDGQRGVINFGHERDRRADKHVPIALYRDVVTHEVTHAILDGYRPHMADPDATVDEHALHEGIADLVAMLSVFSSSDRVLDQLQSRLDSSDRPNGSDDDLVTSGLFDIADGLFSRKELRRSITDEIPQDWRSIMEPHVRGSVVVKALMTAVLDLWKTRMNLPGGRASEYQKAQSGAKVGRQMLGMLIRGLGYMPPIDLTFRDLLHGMLAADQVVVPDDTLDYRGSLREAFKPFGITADPDHELDGLTGLRDLRYPVRLSALASDPEEVYRFLWENPAILRAAAVDPDVPILVERVRPSLRVGPDGFVVSEIGANFTQMVPMTQREALNRLGLHTQGDIILRGGGLIRFNEGGRLAYATFKPVLDAERQQRRWSRRSRDEMGDLSAQEDPDARSSVFAQMHRAANTDD